MYIVENKKEKAGSDKLVIAAAVEKYGDGVLTLGAAGPDHLTALPPSRQRGRFLLARQLSSAV
jgi:hypothetical protein